MRANKRIVMFSALSVAAGIQLSPGVARAAEVCDTVDACRALQAEVEARLSVLLANLAPRTQDAANGYCLSQGQRLPTARELALYSQSLGAEGISETAKAGYILVLGSDSAGNPDRFYFSAQGYRRPAGDLGNAWFWSSSIAQDLTNNYAYGLVGASGALGLAYRGSAPAPGGPVRCELPR